LDVEAPLPSAFHQQGVEWASYVVSIGPLLGLTTTLFASIFSFTRITYTMAEDGLLLSLCSKVTQRTGIPVWSSLIGAFFMALQACFFDIRHILSFGVVLSLFQLILVSASVIILRYRPSEITKTHQESEDGENICQKNSTNGMAQNILSGEVPQSPVCDSTSKTTEVATDMATFDLQASPVPQDGRAETTTLLNEDDYERSKRQLQRKKKTRKKRLQISEKASKEERVYEEGLRVVKYFQRGGRE